MNGMKMSHCFFDEMHEIMKEAKERREHPALTAAKGIGVLALGAGTGYVLTEGADRGIRALGGKGIPQRVKQIGAPIVGGAAGLGYGLLQHKMMGRMKHNLQPEEEQDDGVTEGTAT
jgi:hypothetical protein